MRRISSVLVAALSVLIGSAAPGVADEAKDNDMKATMPHAQMVPPAEPPGMPAEEKMNRRFPQKVRTGDLIGLSLIDFDNRSLGDVAAVVRTPSGNVVLVVDTAGILGWHRRKVAIPLETVGILGRQIALLDIARDGFFALPAWIAGDSHSIAPNETLRIALARR